MNAAHTPNAVLSKRENPPLAMLLPVLAALFVGWLFYSYNGDQGVPVTIEFAEGHGLKPGDALKYRGITVGTVSDVVLAATLNRVIVHARLASESINIAKEGSRFWIVRAQLDLTGTKGLETLVGANYITVIPGEGPNKRSFVGVEEPPLLDIVDPKGRRLELSSPNAKSISEGAPITFRQVQVGVILKIGLTDSGSQARLQAYLYPDYTYLAREKTVFWASGGASVEANILTGISVNVDSVESLVRGGVSLALPRVPGPETDADHVYTLHDEPKDVWLEWLDSEFPAKDMETLTSL